MQAVVVMAGESSRFWPINNKHKAQTEILGKPLVYWTIKGLLDNEIKDIVLVCNEKSISIKEKLTTLNANINYVIQEKPLGTGNAIYIAKDKINGPFFVVWGYQFISNDIIKNILEAKDKEGFDSALVCCPTDSPYDYGIVSFNEENEFDKIVENPSKEEKIDNARKMLGVWLLDPEFFSIYQNMDKKHEEDYIDALNIYFKQKGNKGRCLNYHKSLFSLKYPWNLLNAMDLLFKSNFKSHISPSAKIGKNVVFDENKVFIGENVIIGDNTVIDGYCYIGDNSIIGFSNVLRGLVCLGKDTMTGSFMEIKHSIIGNGTHFHSGYFGDSIAGKDCRFGAGFVIANKRADRDKVKSIVKEDKVDTKLIAFGCAVGDNTKFGINASTMPGVLIGSNCMIGPGTMVFENLEDNKVLYTKFETKKKDIKQ